MAKPKRSEGRQDHARCIDCGASRYDGTRLSARGLCGPCGEQRSIESLTQIATRQGPGYERWARGLVRAGERALQNAS